MHTSLINAKLFEHGVERTSFDLILEIAQSGHTFSEIQSRVTALTAFSGEPNYYLPAFSKRVYLLINSLSLTIQAGTKMPGLATLAFRHFIWERVRFDPVNRIVN
ncbi:MAG: hypothetical protein ACREV9_05640 [Burkholderiales bacterium]